jgi:hypothetical protein
MEDEGIELDIGEEGKSVWHVIIQGVSGDSGTKES